ncbi:MAG: ABC transporter permease subunit [Oscillospiraceae bacterium]|nr:ABC transporter permease subunit [Oscillospiraceae bacterium]
MSRILQANIFRLRKSRLFRWTVILTAMVTAVVVLLDSSSMGARIADYELENIALSGAPFVQMIIAAVIVLFLGTDHSHKTIRNKLIVGSRRGEIYSANVLTGMVIGCAINAAWLVGGLSGVPALGFWDMEPDKAFMYIGMSFVCTVSLCSIAALFGMMIRSRSAAIVAAFAALFVLLAGASMSEQRLSNNKEELSGHIVDDELVFEIAENPDYVDGPMRAAFELALNANPMGISTMLSNKELGNRDYSNPTVGLVGAAFVTIFVSSLGAAMFGRRDLT